MMDKFKTDIQIVLIAGSIIMTLCTFLQEQKLRKQAALQELRQMQIVKQGIVTLDSMNQIRERHIIDSLNAHVQSLHQDINRIQQVNSKLQQQNEKLDAIYRTVSPIAMPDL